MIITPKNIIHTLVIIVILALLFWGILNRRLFFQDSVDLSSIPVVDSIGFEPHELPRTASQKVVGINPHEIVISPPPKKKYSTKYLVVFLSKKILGAIDGKDYVHTFYNINLPVNTVNGKSQKGDKLVPIGDYYVLQHDLRGNSMFLTINYPNSKDAARAYKAGLISEADYNAIASAEKKSILPPFNTALGGPIVIRGDGAPGKNTAGNIGVPPDAAKKIWEFAKKGTPVRILP